MAGDRKDGIFLLLTAIIIYVPYWVFMVLRGFGEPFPPEKELVLYLLLRVTISQLILSFLETAAILIIGSREERKRSGKEPLSFGETLYRGLKAWPKAAVTQGFFLSFALFAWTGLYAFGMWRGILTWFWALFLALGFYVFAAQIPAALCAVTRGVMGLSNLRWSYTVVKKDFQGFFRVCAPAYLAGVVLPEIALLLAAFFAGNVESTLLRLLLLVAAGLVFSLPRLIAYRLVAKWFLKVQENAEK